ncbi:MAG: DUF2155 domain-containing protein [Candidatus Nitrohelix vancouverensis]|uniref:DUF2155 domain-containing protein n=1 Tax=Candidatus Nitrohelix vancouverensis TaxID=2705534 RepID=A0A7T0C137_9BACT|nr:MAG: DUF2155 domain-containing protein [Candidatus Nitrohelix vancouverensis]
MNRILINSLGLAVLAMSFTACSMEADEPLKLDAQQAKMPENLPEGSSSRRAVEAANPQELQVAETYPEGSLGGDNKNHPQVQGQEKLDRELFIPEDLKGKWKSVKLLVGHKKDEELTQIKTIDLGTSFELKDAGLKVTVGPFFPNFVMNKSSYSSMNNEPLNPAVQLLVEENGKRIYKGWAFANYPGLYAFEHDVYKVELLDFIPANVS